MMRKIIHIDEEKCNGCGLCVDACHERAIELVDGKARLVSDEYCDGLGDCLPECPTGAISIIERIGKPFDVEAVKERLKEFEKEEKAISCGCPGTLAKSMKKNDKAENQVKKENKHDCCNTDDIVPNSELNQWPVQISLINPNASYFKNADILIAADCTAYAYGNFHKDFMKEKITLIGCPKLDNIAYYMEKFVEIFKNNDIKSITVVRMQVPCCNGIVSAVKKAMLAAEMVVPYNEIVISAEGKIL